MRCSEQKFVHMNQVLSSYWQTSFTVYGKLLYDISDLKDLRFLKAGKNK